MDVPVVIKRFALQFLKYSEWARLNHKDLLEISKFASNENNFLFLDNKDTDTQGYCLYDKHAKTIYIFFRGSQQLRDWLTDFNAFHKVFPYPNMNPESKIRVHQGFIKCWKSVRRDVHKFIDSLIGKKIPIKRIAIGGHSLGGALATLCAVDIQYNFPFFSRIIEGYVSGNPAVFNRAGEKSFNTRVPNFYRTYMRTDWVPFLPPKWFGNKLHGGYNHVGAPIPIGPKKWFYGLRVWIRTLRKPSTLAENLTNHSIRMYRKWLKR